MLGGWTEAGPEMTRGQGCASPSFQRTYHWWGTGPGPMQIRGQNFHQSEGSSGTSLQVLGGAWSLALIAGVTSSAFLVSKFLMGSPFQLRRQGWLVVVVSIQALCTEGQGRFHHCFQFCLG